MPVLMKRQLKIELQRKYKKKRRKKGGKEEHNLEIEENNFHN